MAARQFQGTGWLVKRAAGNDKPMSHYIQGADQNTDTIGRRSTTMLEIRKLPQMVRDEGFSPLCTTHSGAFDGD